MERIYSGPPREHVDWSIHVGGSLGFEEYSVCSFGDRATHCHDNSLHGACDPEEESRLQLFADHVMRRGGRRRRGSASCSSQSQSLPATRVAAPQPRSQQWLGQ